MTANAIEVYIDEIDWTQCPKSVESSLRNYLEHHTATGGFLECVLSNDLAGSFGRADETNRACLYEIIQFLYNEAPAISWGSKNKYNTWLKGG